jgi:transposase
MDTPTDRNPPRPDQPTLFAMPADDDAPPRPAAPPPPPGRPRLRTANRQQIVFRTAALDELIPADHPARIVWDFVEGLDLSPLYDVIQSVVGTAGRPAIDPKILMALWLYATIDGVGSARQLDRLCHSHDAYRWLLGDVAINYHTLADFRTDPVALLDRLLTESVAALLAEGLVDLQRVAQDGMRVRASAGAASFRRPRPRSRHCGRSWSKIRPPATAADRRPVSVPPASVPSGFGRRWIGCRSWRPARSRRTARRRDARPPTRTRR